jgi:hypothetical protein
LVSTLKPSEDDSNPFRPPAAPLAVTPDAASIRFFTASPLKFAVMSIATFSLYCLYWLYKNFKVMRDTENAKIMPFWRALFSVIWSYSAFSAILARGGPALAAGRSAAGLAVSYAVLSVASRLPDPWWLVSLFAIVPVMIANGWAREVNGLLEPGYPENSRFDVGDWVAIVVGGLFVALVLTGLFLPTPE